MISFEDFLKMDIRVGKVISAERVKNSVKLVKLIVDLGLEKRQLVAGIAGYYSPEELVGRNIIVLANLKPKKIMGVESQGMLLAAVVDNKPVLLTTDKDVPPGTKVS
ncbi:MAG: methionine--tRNA ligase subunit beta [Thermoprotei archaeon]|nr:MAG: methionine--tRNA ligase subunit beta [Thermoprotei archaeon]